MTNEIEKQFFDKFGIKPLIENIPCSECEFNLEECGCFYCNREIYPQITDRKLLELICIINQIDLYFYGEYDYFTTVNYKDLKEEVIAKCKRLVDKNAISEFTGEYIKQQIQALFKE